MLARIIVFVMMKILILVTDANVGMVLKETRIFQMAA